MVPIKSIAGKDRCCIVSATIASKQVPKTLELGIDVVAHGRMNKIIGRRRTEPK